MPLHLCEIINVEGMQAAFLTAAAAAAATCKKNKT